WERTTKLNLGAGQVMTVSTRYTYEGEVEKEGRTLDRISSKVLTVEFALEPGSPLPFTVKESALKPAETKGEILFDRKLGQVVSATSSIQIVGDMTFVINNMELPSKLDLKMETDTEPKHKPLLVQVSNQPSTGRAPARSVAAGLWSTKWLSQLQR